MSTDSKKDEFKKYLERSGVLDTLTKVLVELYEEPEKPGNALEFLRNQIGSVHSNDEESDLEKLKAVVSELEEKLEQLTLENEMLKSQLEEFQRNAIPQEVGNEAQ